MQSYLLRTAMPFSSSTNWDSTIKPDEIQNFIEPLQKDDNELFDRFIIWPPEEIPLYLQGPSTTDGVESIESGFHEPALTGGPTLASSDRPITSPSLGYSPEDTRLHHHGTNSASLKEGCNVLSAPQLDLRHIGEGPGIHQQQLIHPVFNPRDDEFSINLSPGVSDNNSISLAAVVPHHHVSLAVESARTSSQPGPSGLPAPPTRKGRSSPLPEAKRVKVAGMRSTKACMRCRIRKVECDDSVPCKRCRKEFPRHPNVCDRTRLVDIRFPSPTSLSIWLHDSNDPFLPKISWQLTGYPLQVRVTFNQVATERTPQLMLTLQRYVFDATAFPQVRRGQYLPPAATTFGTVPMSTNGNWPGTFPLSKEEEIQYRLICNQQLSTGELLNWVEKQVLWELEESVTSFDAAVGALIFSLRDTPLEGILANLKAPSTSKKGSSNSTPTSPLPLLRNVCEMRCWFRIWQAPILHIQGSGTEGLTRPLPATALSQLKRLALPALIACEKQVLTRLDGMLSIGIRGIEVPVWGCLWVTILMYRQFIEKATEQVPAALLVVINLHRLLLIRYAAYFGSSSPIHPKPGQPTTQELLKGNDGLLRAWNRVLILRKEFHQQVSESNAPSDDLIKTLIINVDAKLERKRKNGSR